MPPRPKPKRKSGGRRIRGAPPPVLLFCALLCLLSLLCRFCSFSLGPLGDLPSAIALYFFGAGAPLLPLFLLSLAVWGPRRSLSLLRLGIYLLASLDGTPFDGGLLGRIFARLFALLFGKAGARIVLLMLLFLPPLYRLRRPLARWSARVLSALGKSFRKDLAMFSFKKKKPTVVTGSEKRPDTPFADESFLSLRARLEREESVHLDLPDEASRTICPGALDASLDIPLDGESPAFSSEAEPLWDEVPEDKAPTAEPSALGDVVSADAFFGGGIFSASEAQESALFAIRGGVPQDVRSFEPTDAPFARPTVFAPREEIPPVKAPESATYPSQAVAAEPIVEPIAEPIVEPIEPIPEPIAEPIEPIQEPIKPALPSSEAPASAIFAAGAVRTLSSGGERISDGALPRAAEPTARPSVAPPASAVSAPYVYPPLSLLKPSETVAGSSDEEIRRNSESLLETLASFNVQASIRHVSRGPRITRYELIPKRGVRIRNITNLQDDISMNLATAGIRIEAPIPGLSAVGVEVPNRKSTAVRLRDMLDHESFRSAASKTTVCVGSDVTGEPVYGDIAKMPHALIAGATGMGKSVCINAILLSLLYKASPEEVKLILVDPKKVELGVYNGIPHLLVPVVVEPQKAAGALVWAVGEMERRFNMIEAAGIRDIKGYNRIVRERGEKPLPQIVIVIDELNDLMMSARDAVEDSICRIAQKARAAGIHLLIGTQRPSVDVITGVIKANIPSRLAFHVSSQVDSRTILDMTGAEKLLNNGDMLFFPVGVPKPIRVQGAFVEDDEVEAVTTFLKRGVGGAAVYDDEVMANIEREAEKCMPKDKRADRSELDGIDGGDDLLSDPQFVAAVEIAIGLGQISTSKIQTKLRIGFQKATNFVEAMEEMGIVGPLNGSKPRDVLITADQFLEMKARR